MRRHFRSTVTGLLLMLVGTVAQAGPNQGGTLILHYAGYYGRYYLGCGHTGLIDCADAVTTVPSGMMILWSVLAAFPEASSPRLASVAFNVDVSSGYAYHPDCCGSAYTADPAWPTHGGAVQVTWDTPQSSTLTEIWSFVGYVYAGPPTEFTLGPHPTLGGVFGDDSEQTQFDPIADYGRLGFNGAPGFLPCPAPGAACCLTSGTCEVMTQVACATEGGLWLPESAGCDPNPCPTPIENRSWGWVKAAYR